MAVSVVPVSYIGPAFVLEMDAVEEKAQFEETGHHVHYSVPHEVSGIDLVEACRNLNRSRTMCEVT